MLDLDLVLKVADTHPKSKSSTPNLLYLISTFRYMTGTSAFRLDNSVAPIASATSLILLSPDESLADSLAFSLRNLGACKLVVAFSVVLVFSVTFRSTGRAKRPYPPQSMALKEVMTWWSGFCGGAPTSKIIWLGHADSNWSL